MNRPQTEIVEEAAKNIQYALLDDEAIAVVRVAGRGTFLNSVPLKKFADQLAASGKPRQIIVDLKDCETLDSTFMGVLAAISLRQTRAGRDKLILTNINPHIQRLLKTLGLSNLIQLRDGTSEQEALRRAEGGLESPEERPVSHVEQICHTLEAHRTLVKVDEENEVRFQCVIHYLEKSLQDAEKS